MNLNINLFVHGVPLGQKIWGPKNDDHIYISSFYGPKWDVPEVMKIDVMSFGGITYCYYSFVKGQNVYDSQGRPGSYFGLTLRINAFYADVQNIYNVLKAAYDKMCVGLCVSENNGLIKFLTSDFEIIDAKLKNIENHIINYICEFSISNDIISLNDFPTSSQVAIQNANLHECTREFAYNSVRHNGKLMVSPWYLSIDAEQKLSQYKSEMQTVKDKAQQEIQLQKEASEERINSITKHFHDELKSSDEKFQQELTQCKENCEREITKIKNRYAVVDTELDSLKRTIKDRDKEISDWQSKYKKNEKELLLRNQDIKNLRLQLSKMQDDFAEIKADRGYQMMPEPKRTNWILVGIVSFFTVLLVSFLTWFAIQNINGLKELKEQNLNFQKVIEQLEITKKDSIGTDPFEAEDESIDSTPLDSGSASNKE